MMKFTLFLLKTNVNFNVIPHALVILHFVVAKLFTFFSLLNAADLEKSHHQRVSELQRLRSMYVFIFTTCYIYIFNLDFLLFLVQLIDYLNVSDSQRNFFFP